MRIGCDIDDIICDTTRNVLGVHNMDTGDNLTLDDIKTYHIEDYVSPEYRENFHKIFLDNRVWDGVHLLPNCVETIKQLHNSGHEIWFVTATSPENVLKKCNFLERTFPFLDVRKHFITTPCKQMIDVDILIDDAAHNVVNARYSSILFDYPWNRDIDTEKNPNVYGVSGWSDVQKTVNLIYKKGQENYEQNISTH